MYFHPESNRKLKDHSAIRRAFCDGSMPFIVGFEAVISDDILAELGVFPLQDVDSGATDQQTAIEGAPALVNGEWRQTWTVRAATPEELAARAPVVPEAVPKLNARLVLIEAGYWSDVVAFITAQGEVALAYLEDAQTMRRDNPLVNAWAAARGKTAELDGLFIAAAALDV
jgi:hypothetical protein